MSFTITVEAPDRATYDRLFSEAWDYISIERQRRGESELKEGMWTEWQTDGQFARVYRKDDYVVGMDCCVTITKDDERWLFYKQPTFGADSTGSRSWFYEEDFQKVSKEWMNENDYVGFFVFHNPGSPAAIGAQSIWGTTFNGVQYFSPVSEESLEDWGGDGLPETMRAFVSRKTA